MLTQLHKPAFWRFFYGMARAGGAKPTAIEGAEHFAAGDELDVPGQAEVIATPGHTPGHLLLPVRRQGPCCSPATLLTTSNPLQPAASLPR